MGIYLKLLLPFLWSLIYFNLWPPWSLNKALSFTQLLLVDVFFLGPFFCQPLKWLSCSDYPGRSAVCKICDHLAPHCEFIRPLGEDVLDSGSLVLQCSNRSSDGTKTVTHCAHMSWNHRRFYPLAIQITHSYWSKLRSKNVCMVTRSNQTWQLTVLPRCLATWSNG